MQHIAVAFGDGVGPEAMHAVLRIIQEADAKLTVEAIEVGENAYKIGNLGGVPESAITTLKRCTMLLKAPTSLPGSEGYASVTETILAHFPAQLKLWATSAHMLHTEAEGSEKNEKLCTEKLPNMTVAFCATPPAELEWQLHLGEDLLIFESLQPPLPGHAGRDMAAFDALLDAACMMLNILGFTDITARISRAREKTAEENITVPTHGTTAAVDAIIAKLWA